MAPFALAPFAMSNSSAPARSDAGYPLREPGHGLRSAILEGSSQSKGSSCGDHPPEMDDFYRSPTLVARGCDLSNHQSPKKIEMSSLSSRNTGGSLQTEDRFEDHGRTAPRLPTPAHAHDDTGRATLTTAAPPGLNFQGHGAEPEQLQQQQQQRQQSEEAFDQVNLASDVRKISQPGGSSSSQSVSYAGDRDDFLVPTFATGYPGMPPVMPPPGMCDSPPFDELCMMSFVNGMPPAMMPPLGMPPFYVGMPSTILNDCWSPGLLPSVPPVLPPSLEKTHGAPPQSLVAKDEIPPDDEESDPSDPLHQAIKKVSRLPDGVHHFAESCEEGYYNHYVLYKTNGAKLKSMNKQDVSREFFLPIGAVEGGVAFRMVLHPKLSYLSKGGGCFKKARGVSSIELKCLSDTALCDKDATLNFDLAVGSDGHGKFDPRRGPFNHNFKQNNNAQLPKDKEQWNLTQAVGQDGKFIVALEVLNLTSDGNKQGVRS